MSISIATLGMYTQPGVGGGGGGAPPVHQYEARGEDFVSIKVKNAKIIEPEEVDKIIIKIGRVTSDEVFD